MILKNCSLISELSSPDAPDRADVVIEGKSWIFREPPFFPA